MAKSILQGCKKVTIAIYNPEGCKLSQISFFAKADGAAEIVGLFERMDGDYLGAFLTLFARFGLFAGIGSLRRLIRYYGAARTLYRRDKIARAYLGRAPRHLGTKTYRFRALKGPHMICASSPAAAYMVYKSYYHDDVYVYDYLLSEETVFGGCFCQTNKRDPHGIGYMRVVPAGRKERH